MRFHCFICFATRKNGGGGGNARECFFLRSPGYYTYTARARLATTRYYTYTALATPRYYTYAALATTQYYTYAAAHIGSSAAVRTYDWEFSARPSSVMTDLKPGARRAAEKEQSVDGACLKNADVVKKVADDAAVKNAPKMAANKLAPLFVADAFFRRAERFHDQRGFFQEIFNTGRDDFIEIKVNFMCVADQAYIALFIL